MQSLSAVCSTPPGPSLAFLRSQPKDLIVPLGKGEISVNKAVLCAQSVFFNTYFTSQVGAEKKENSLTFPQTVTLQHFDPVWTPCILDLLQTSSHSLNEKNYLGFLDDPEKGMLGKEGLEDDLIFLYTKTASSSIKEKCRHLAISKAIQLLTSGNATSLERLRPILGDCKFLDHLEHPELNKLSHFQLEVLVRSLSPDLWGIKLEKINTPLFFLASCPNLVFLSITKSSIQSIEELQGLKKLKKVDFSGNTGTCDARPFIFLKELEEVNIQGWKELKPLSYLDSCPLLRKIIIDDQYPDLAGIKERWKEKLVIRPLTN